MLRALLIDLDGVIRLWRSQRRNSSLAGVRRYVDQAQRFITFLGDGAEPEAITYCSIVHYRVFMMKRGCKGARRVL